MMRNAALMLNYGGGPSELTTAGKSYLRRRMRGIKFRCKPAPACHGYGGPRLR